MKATETRTLATKFKDAFKKTSGCTIEIRAPVKNATAQRLQKSLTLAGIKSQLIQVPAVPSSGVLIEAAQECAQTAVSIQTAFKVVSINAHLLIQNTARPDLVIIHLGSEAPEN